MKPYTRQPNQPVTVSPHWITRGLKFISLGNGMFWSEGVWYGTTTTNGAPRNLPNQQGAGYAKGFGATSGGGNTDSIIGPMFASSAAFRSIFASYKPNSAGGGGLGRIFINRTDAVSSNFEGLFYTTTVGGSIAYSKSFNGAGLFGQWYTTPDTFGEWTTVGMTHDQTTTGFNPTFYKKGVLSNTLVGSGSSGSYDTQKTVFVSGNRPSDNNRTFDGVIGPVFIFDHPTLGLTDQEHKDLYVNPWQVFADRRSIFASLPASGNVAFSPRAPYMTGVLSIKG